MENQVLSIEQMKHLQTLGVDISTDHTKTNWGKWDGENVLAYGIPGHGICRAFALHEIIELLPSPIKYKEVEYFLSIRKNAYGYGVSYHTGGHGSLTLMKCKSIIECAYQMLIWVIKNGYLSK